MKLAELESIITGLKAGGLDTEAIKRTLANILDAQKLSWKDKIDVPKFGDDGVTVVETLPMTIKDIVDNRVKVVDTTDTNEDWEKAKTEAEPKIKSKELQDKLEADRAAAVPENEKRSKEEQAKITEGYANEVNPDISEGGKNALYADIDQAKQKEFIRKVDNNFNRLAGSDNDEAFANKVIAELVASKNKGVPFTSSLSKDTILAISDHLSKKEGKDGKKHTDMSALKDVLNGLKDTYEHESFGRLKASLNMMHSKGNTSKNRLARELERVGETEGTDKGAQEAMARSVKPGSIAKREGITEFDKIFAGGTEADAAKKALVQDVNAYDKAFTNDPELRKQLDRYVADAQKANYSVEDWLKYFEEHPGVKFHNQANARTVNNGALLLTAFTDDNASGERFPLIKEVDVTNFLKALQQAENKPEVKTEFTNLNTKVSDATEDSPRNKKWIDRFDRMFKTGDKFIVYTDPNLSKKYTRDENGFVTEYDRDPKEASGPSLRRADYFSQLANIMKDPKSSVPMLYDLISTAHGKDAATKAKDLYNDVMTLNDVFGPVITPENVDPGILRSFAGKFNRLRKANPNAESLADILNSGDVSDVFGVKIHPKFTDNKKFTRNDLLKAALKLAQYKKNAAKGGLDFDALRSDLDENIKAYQNAVDTNNFSQFPEGMDASLAAEALEALNTARSFVDTPTEREAKLRTGITGTKDKDALRSLAEESPEDYENAVAEYQNAVNEWKLAKDQKADFDVINVLRKDIDEKRSTVDYLKNTKVDILKKAEELGKPYEEVLNDYLHPDWDEDNLELNIQKTLDEFDLMDQLKESAGGSIHNSNVKASAVSKILDKLSTVDPRFEKWRDITNAWARPVPASSLMASVDTAKNYLGMTPAEWSAYNTNKGFFDSDVEQKRRNTTLYGQGKSAKGAAGADTVALDKLAKDLQFMDYTDDTAGKKQLYDKLQAENKAANDPYTRDKDIDERLANAIKGVLANRPGEDK